MFEFRDDDVGYLAWVAAHPDGFVINIRRGYNAVDARIHHAGCRTISGKNPRAGPWTAAYVKVCAEELAALERWATDTLGKAVLGCALCHAVPIGERSGVVEAPKLGASSPELERRYQIRGPSAQRAIVEAWADDYIRFERRPEWQERLRAEIRARSRELEPSLGQVLHATFFGAKRDNADVENLALYNIDSFTVAGRYGTRFEHGIAPPRAPDGNDYAFGYRYALRPHSADFDHWRTGRYLASFDWTDLGPLVGDPKLAHVWLALARAEIDMTAPRRSPDTPFAVKIEIRPPRGRLVRLGRLVKGVFDGVICALQAHTDTTILPAAAALIATGVPASATEIERRLLDQRRAVLGPVPRLVYPYRAAVKWDPADHLCVAGELLAAEPTSQSWSITGHVVEVARPTDRRRNLQ